MVAPRINRALAPTHPFNANHEPGQAANTGFQVFGLTRPGIKPNLAALVARAHPTVPSTTVVAIGKARGACVQASHCGSKQQQRSHAAITLAACSHHAYILLFFAHIPFVVNHTTNATPAEKLQQHPFLFATNRTIPRSFCEGSTWHDLHILVTAPFCCDRKNPSGMCAKLRTVAASNNRDHTPRSLLLLVRATHIYCCSSRTSRSWWITQSTQCQRRGCNTVKWIKMPFVGMKLWSLFLVFTQTMLGYCTFDV